MRTYDEKVNAGESARTRRYKISQCRFLMKSEERRVGSKIELPSSGQEAWRLRPDWVANSKDRTIDFIKDNHALKAY
jgi:hypothetical protein